MNRPGLTGWLLLVAFSIPVVIESKTLLAMFGIEMSTVVFAPLALAGFVLVVSFALFFLHEDEPGNLSKA